MRIEIRPVEFAEVESLRELYRSEAKCQIIHDSALARGMADPYLIMVNDRIGGYGGVWNRFDVGRVLEFYTLPPVRSAAQPMFRELIAASKATSIEAQTNMPLMMTMLFDFAHGILQEKILFEDGFTTAIPSPPGVFRRAELGDSMPDAKEELGEWVFESKGRVVATGGFLCHYNPPYGDVYMSVAESHRMQGIGSFLVQEVKRVCYEAGRKPAARCNPENEASRRTLQKAGMLPVARLLAGKLTEPK